MWSFARHRLLPPACYIALVALITFFALAIVFVPALAHATGAVRVEWMKTNVVLGAQTISSSGVSTASTAAPSFGGVAGQARLTVTEGAVVVYCCSDSPTATQTNGVRLQVGDPPYLVTGVSGGTKLAVIEATDPPAALVADVEVSGVTGIATEETLASLLEEAQTPATSLPNFAPEAAAAVTYTYAKVAISTATDTTLVAGTADQTVRLHGIACTISAADNLTFKSASTALSPTWRFPAGGGWIFWRRSPEFHIPPTTAGEALVLTTTTTANVDCGYWYRKD